MKNKLKLITIGWLLAAIGFSARAQGTAFTYQGRLNSSGSPASGNYDFRFRLDADPLGNTILATAFTNSVPVTNGLFITTIDFGAGWFNGSNYWLEVDVRTNAASTYVGLTPLQPLLPTPYAIMANSASNLLGALPAAQLSGTLQNSSLPASPTFSGAVTANSFSGNGASVTGVNAASLNGLGAANFWQTGGNSGTTPGVNFLGTKDNQPLEFKVNGQRGLRLEYATNGYVNPLSGAIVYQSVNVIGGYSGNFVSNGVVGATIGGGGVDYTGGFIDSFPNSVSANFGTVSGGEENTASGGASTVGGGDWNTASGVDSIVGGGFGCVASGPGSVVAGGGYNGFGSAGNGASGGASTVGGGWNNSSSGRGATVPGGEGNTAGGMDSFAAGAGATANHQGSFVWADSTQGNYSDTASNQFLIRASGGVGIGINNPTDASLSVAGKVRLNDNNIYFRPGTDTNHGIGYYYGSKSFAGNSTIDGPVLFGFNSGVLGTEQFGSEHISLQWDSSSVSVYGTFNNNSDRNAKRDFTTVSPSHILDKVAQLPVSEWSYNVDADTRHIGPMAQDFYNIFNVGTDDKHIAPIDEGGVALAAIQGLNQKVNSDQSRLQTELHQKDAEIQELKQRLETLEKIVLKQTSN